jgi:hypothetical protein
MQPGDSQKRLARYRGRNPLVLAIPRGAVEMGRFVADELGGELDVVLAQAPLADEPRVGSRVDRRERLGRTLQNTPPPRGRTQRIWSTKSYKATRDVAQAAGHVYAQPHADRCQRARE